MTRQELHALVTDILAIHACPCLPCVNSMTDRADTIMRAVDMLVGDVLLAPGETA